MKRTTLIVALFLIATQVFSQSLGYNNNRFAVSADGNNQPDNLHKWPKADPDDWGATPAALAMIAKLNLQDKLVHYSYNNFIEAPAHTSAVNEMKLGADGGIERWNFDAKRFFDVSAGADTAINHLAAELAKSTVDDPLYFIHMGPAEFFYRAVKKVVDHGNAGSLAHVYVISHSGYNDNHLRRGDPDFDKEPVAPSDKHHTMAEAITLSGDRINYKKIKDQNAGSQPNVLWKSDKDWTVWHWMRDHADTNIQWIYERMLANAKSSADISDAGMLYYLLVGDENGSPSKFKAFIGNGITVGNLPECSDLTLTGIKDFEMAQIDTFVIPYKDNGRNAVAVNAGAYKNRYAATQKVFNGVSGNYNITLTTLTEIDGESTYRLSINGKLIGKFQNPESDKDMSEFKYTFDNVPVESDDIIQIESNTHSNGKIPEGEAYAFSRGRWRSISFECASECFMEEKNGLLIFEAERFTLKGQWKVGDDADKASGGQYIYFDGSNSYESVNSSNSISYTFKINNAGTYTFKWLMRQPDGERGTDKGNDAWFYFSGNIARGSGVALTDYEKFVGRSDDNFTLNGQADLHGKQPWVNVTFPSAGEYTLNISGRSHGLQIDRFVFYKGINFDQAKVKIGEISETFNCDVTAPEEPDDNETDNKPSTVNYNSNENLQVYPNPAHDKLYIQVPGSDTSVISVLNLNGKKLQSYTCDSTMTELDVSGLIPGVYLLTVENSGSAYHKRILIR